MVNYIPASEAHSLSTFAQSVQNEQNVLTAILAATEEGKFFIEVPNFRFSVIVVEKLERLGYKIDFYIKQDLIPYIKISW